MTDSLAPRDGDPAQDESVYSKDYWDNVFEQVGRRPLVKIALALLALLYATAIYAPLVANDRPFVLEAVDYRDYSRAQKTLFAIGASFVRLAGQTEEEFLEKLSDAATIRTYAGAVEKERTAFANKTATMLQYLPDAEHAPLVALRDKSSEVADLILAGDRETAQAVAKELRDEARAVRKDYKAVDPEDPDAGGKVLVATTSYPAFETITGIDAFFMWLWGLVLTWPLWNAFLNRVVLGRDRERIRKWRRVKLTGVALSSLVVGGVWWATIGGELVFESSPFKGGLTSGELVADRAAFPPIALGFSETHMGERYRPPTWWEHSELDDDGRYVSGPRVIEPDPVTGYVPPPQPVEIRYGEPELNAKSRHLLGTDTLGRDLFVRILYGGRISLLVGILSTLLLVTIGVIMGSFAGYFGGWVDIVISRLIEIFQSIPAFFVILTAVAMIPDDKLHPIFAIVFFIALVRWTGVARLVRAEFLRLKEQEFVIAAQALGFRNSRVIFRHVLPNGMGPVLVAAAFSVAAGILTESAISFLGFGVKDPTPSWGSLLSEARGGGSQYPWLQIFPGLLIFVTVFCYNIVGEGIRDALDPRRKV